MGYGGTEKMLKATGDTTQLFYWWEPSALISDDSNFLRMYFDAAIACPSDTVAKSYLLYPNQATCDFEAGKPHKGYSERMRKSLPDAAAVVDAMNLMAENITSLLVRAAASDLSWSEAHRQVACEWVLENEATWSTWLGPKERAILEASITGGIDDSIYVYIALIVVLLLLMWLCVPICCTRRTSGVPTPGQTWERWAMYPGFAHQLWGLLVWPCTKSPCAKADPADTWSPADTETKSKTVKADEEVSTKVAPAEESAMPTRSLTDIEQLAGGCQWATRRVFGKEGEVIKVSIVRQRSMAKKPLKLRIWGEDPSVKGLSAGTVEKIGQRTIELKAGQTVTTFVLELPHESSGSLDLKNGVWQPETTFLLKLGNADGSNDGMGITDTAQVTIVDSDDWPFPNASSMSKAELYRKFVKQVIRDNLENEIFWFIGVVIRATHDYLFNPLMFVWFIGDVFGKANFELGLRLACYKVALIWLDDYTYFHYSSNVGVAIYAPIQWLLYKWNALPLDLQLDHERLSEFRRVRVALRLVRLTHPRPLPRAAASPLLPSPSLLLTHTYALTH